MNPAARSAHAHLQALAFGNYLPFRSSMGILALGNYQDVVLVDWTGRVGGM